MASTTTHKVCFPVAGKPAIVRAIDTYKAAGLRRFLVVVGQMAEQVIATVSLAHPDATFVYQAEQRGTGHAAAVAADALAAQDFQGTAMIVMGDKVATVEVVRRLIRQYVSGKPDVLLTTAPKHMESTAGRIVLDGQDRPIGIVELPDIKEARRRRSRISVGGHSLTAGQVEKRSRSTNSSLYIFRFAALKEALGRLRSDNAQGELYLTDTIEHIARGGKVQTMDLTDATELMAFNTPEELLDIERVVRSRQKPPRVRPQPRLELAQQFLKPARQWLSIVRSNDAAWRRLLGKTYGADEAFLAERSRTIRQLIERFITLHGPQRPMILCRAPGRANLMGRHVDHRGGFVNVMAISKETLLAAAPRDDDAVSMRNVDPRAFPDRQFRIRDLLRDASWTDWHDFVDSRTVQDVLQSAQGDWSHYARAPLLRLQHECREVAVKGMDCLVTGNIPIAAGLSSSSALVVAFAEAAVALNALDVETTDFINLCGEGEWFVGTRGGAADHAAIRISRFGQISRFGFFPFRMLGEVPFSPDLCLVIANSGSKAAKSGAARDIYNHRVASYDVAELLLKRIWPAAAGIERLRDLTPRRLGVSAGDIYRALARLPMRATRAQLRKLLPDDQERLDRLFGTHRDLGGYDLRGITLYGIGEVLRSERFADIMASGDLAAVGRYMRDSHDGDRIVRYDGKGRPHKHVVHLTDAALGQLAAGWTWPLNAGATRAARRPSIGWSIWPIRPTASSAPNWPVRAWAAA
jgi:N-acetylgalactosamine kinase